MSEQRSPEQGRDAEEEPKSEAKQAPAAPASEFASDTGLQRRLSSFGPPKGTGERRSLYDRLVESGALDLDQAAAALAHEPLAVALGSEPRTSTDGTVRDLADELEPSRDSGEQGRQSSMPLRDSDLSFVAESRDSGGFVSALGKDPDADEPGFARAPEGALRPTLRSRRQPDPPMRPPLPSVVLSPQISTRYDSTERISTASVPNTHPLANSMAPTAAARSERPDADKRTSGLWLGLAAAAVVALGVGFATYRGAGSAERRTSAARQPERPPAELEPIVREVPAPPPVVEAAPAPAPEKAAEPAADDREARAERRRARREARAEEGQETPPRPSSAGATRPEAAGATAKPLAAQPTRDEVVAAMNSVMPRLRECVGEKHGLADVTVTVRGAGFVSYALVAGTFVGTPEGSCIARVVKEARFPAFSEPFVRVTYPYQL